jgi:hypothetical protein
VRDCGCARLRAPGGKLIATDAIDLIYKRVLISELVEQEGLASDRPRGAERPCAW